MKSYSPAAFVVIVESNPVSCSNDFPFKPSISVLEVGQINSYSLYTVFPLESVSPVGTDTVSIISVVNPGIALSP